MIDKILTLLQLPQEEFCQVWSMEAVWSTLTQKSSVLTKKIVLIEHPLPLVAKDRELVVQDGVALFREVNVNTGAYYFFANKDAETSFDDQVESFLKKYGSYVIGIDDLTLEKIVVNELHQKRMLISCAESCTGGMLISRIISVPGASLVTTESYVTYSDKAKTKILGVKSSVLESFGTVSPEVASKMALGVQRISKSDVGIGVTGYTTSDSPTANDGIFYYAIAFNDRLLVEKDEVKGTRDEMRFAQTNIILWRLLGLLKPST